MAEPTVAQLLDYTDDAEECNACFALDDQCPYHAGIVAGVDWFAQHLERIADDPEILNRLTERASR